MLHENRIKSNNIRNDNIEAHCYGFQMISSDNEQSRSRSTDGMIAKCMTFRLRRSSSGTKLHGQNVVHFAIIPSVDLLRDCSLSLLINIGNFWNILYCS